MDQIVIVGAGQAGFQAALSLREGGYTGGLVMLGAEPDPPYQRPPLSKAFLTGEADLGKVSLRPPSFFAEHGIELRTGVTVEAVDRVASRVSLVGGESLAYDHLVLATGSRNRPLPVPGAELDGVHGLRTAADAAALKADLARAARLVIVGAGFIGMEVAAVAAKTGTAVTVLEMSGRAMSRTVSEHTARYFEEAHRSRGVAFRCGATAVVIHGHQGRAVAVETADGTVIETDAVLVGIGVIPNTELASGCGLDVRNGIVVGPTLLTSDPSISAAGDCASMPSPFADGASVLIESVQNAVDGAKCLAGRLLGRPEPFAAVPWFWSDQGTDKLQIAGFATPHDDTVVLRSPSAGSFSVLCFRAGHLAGVESVNRAADHMAARRVLSAGARLSREEAGRPDFDLKAAMKALRPA